MLKKLNTYTRFYIFFLFVYSVVVETAIYCHIHSLTVDPFIAANAQLFLVGGGVALFVFGVYGLVEGFWNW